MHENWPTRSERTQDTACHGPYVHHFAGKLARKRLTAHRSLERQLNLVNAD